MEKIIIQDGWELKHVAGSHFQYINKNKPNKVTIPAHPGDISVGVVHSVFKQAQIDYDAVLAHHKHYHEKTEV